MLADTSMEVVLGMPFLPLSNADIGFAERLDWRSYTSRGHAFWPPPRRLRFKIEEDARCGAYRV